MMPGSSRAVDEPRVVIAVSYTHLDVYKRQRLQPAVDDVSFVVRQGSTVGLVGESGSGKSTTARCVAGLTGVDAGSIRLNGVEILSLIHI